MITYREKKQKSILVRPVVSSNFWEEEINKKSDQEIEDVLSELDGEVPKVPEILNISEETENTVPVIGGPGLVGIWFFTAVWCCASLFATIVIGSGIAADLGTGNWETVDGVVTSSSVTESTGGEGGTTYCLNVYYEYVVDGNTYNGDRVSFSSDNSCDSWSQNADDDYPEGSEITVYYDPSDPSESVLESGLSGVDFIMCCFLIFPLIGLLMLYVSIRSTIGHFKKER